jgi:glycosyltransferase involved in cell wall biosynthesis
MPLRIAILCEYPTLNGGERSMLACARLLPNSDAQLTFLAPPDGPLADELSRQSLRHIPLDLHSAETRLPREAALDRLVELCERDFELLHANSLSMGRLTGAAAARLRIPCTAHLRDIVRLSPAAITNLNGNAKLIAVSHAVRDFHVAQGLSADRSNVIPNGIDIDAFRPLRPPGWLRSELGLPASSFLVAAIGQICLRKGQDVYARAAVSAAAFLPDAQFVLIGSRHSAKPESVAFEKGIDEAFASASLSDRFHPLGERLDVPAILGELDVLVHAARQEPFGRVLLEAAAAGVPIVATDVGGTREMLTDGEQAILVRPDDPGAIADALLRLSRDSDLRRRLRDAAQERVAHEFPIERSANELLTTWRRVCDASAMRR